MIQVQQGDSPESTMQIYLTTKSKSYGFISFELLVNQNKDDVIEQYTIIQQFNANTEKLSVHLQEQFSAKVPFDDYDHDTVDYTLTITEHMLNGSEFIPISQVVISDTSKLL